MTSNIITYYTIMVSYYQVKYGDFYTSRTHVTIHFITNYSIIVWQSCMLRSWFFPFSFLSFSLLLHLQHNNGNQWSNQPMKQPTNECVTMQRWQSQLTFIYFTWYIFSLLVLDIRVQRRIYSNVVVLWRNGF